MPAEVARVFATWPPAARSTLATVRDLIYAAAAAKEVGPLTETLKWGQPAYLAESTRSGTTIRLDWQRRTGRCAMLVHCGTTLVDSFRERFADEFEFEKNRAILLPQHGPLPVDAIESCIALTLTYRRQRL